MPFSSCHVPLSFINPAVAISISAVSNLAVGVSTKDLWIFLVGPMLGGALASLLFRMTHPEAVDDFGEMINRLLGGKQEKFMDASVELRERTMTTNPMGTHVKQEI